MRELKSAAPTVENVTSDGHRDLINARPRAGVTRRRREYHRLLTAVFRDAHAPIQISIDVDGGWLAGSHEAADMAVEGALTGGQLAVGR